MENWLGQIQIKIDDKGRFALPSSAVGTLTEKELVLSAGVFEKKPYLEILTVSAWKEKLSVLENFSERNPKLKAYKRFLLSGSAKISLDKQNRLTVPGFQRDLICLQKQAVMVNLDNKIELWSADVWAEISHNFMNDFESLEDWANGFEDVEAEQESTHELKSAA